MNNHQWLVGECTRNSRRAVKNGKRDELCENRH